MADGWVWRFFVVLAFEVFRCSFSTTALESRRSLWRQNRRHRRRSCLQADNATGAPLSCEGHFGPGF